MYVCMYAALIMHQYVQELPLYSRRCIKGEAYYVQLAVLNIYVFSFDLKPLTLFISLISSSSLFQTFSEARVNVL